MEPPAAKKRRCSVEPDEEIDVEDSTFHVHSYPLMMRSPVFRRMLEGDTQEASEGRIQAHR